MRILVLGWVWLACWVNQFKIHSESVAYRKASWSLKTRRLRWTQISALITVIICGSGNIFFVFLSRLAQSCTTDLMNFWSITCCEWPWCEHIFSAGNWFLSNFKSNHQSRTISWILIRFWKRQIENFLKIRARSNRIELDQIWFSCLNRIFVIFTEFLRSFGQKVKTFWVSMPFDTFPNQIHYESILDFPWFSRLISKLFGL